ncbi:MmgE/PrpD family protein [Tropicimonas sp. IMCC34011]|uniref:MmgE/PrpD family protein n=1 Tax=Tropicimonas sp. IMCC34011 TaxID=2248759 RepID=UPI000E285AF9|nr:MmgE/PrpD family protein [Tropicimonas sp. IMCC34011]
MTHETIAGGLARRIENIRFEALPELVRTRAVIGIADTLAVALAGASEDCVRLLRETPGICEAAGPASVIGADARVSMLDAALVNGTASHALDFDDFSSVFGGHQSAPLVAPLLALAEARSARGRDVIAAYAAGVETEIRLARAVHWHHYDKGWHPTATLGTIGAAAASAHLLGLTEPQIATALSIAASDSAGLKANFGSMTKPLHIGRSCRAGLLAALLAERGYTAGARAFEHDQGFFEVFNGAGNYDAEKLFEGWGAPWELEDDGLSLKLWPCCGSAHAAIGAGLDLRQAHGIEAEKIARIEILPHPRRLAHTDTPRPQTPLEAKFSVQYCTARALADGDVTLAHFDADAIADPRIAALLEKTSARPHPQMGDGPEGQWSAEVIVEMADGARHAARIDDITRDPRVMPDRAEGVRTKFMACATRALPSARAEELFERLCALETESDFGGLGALLSGAPAAA